MFRTEGIYSYISAVNSHCETIVKHSDDEIKIISRTGETKVVKLPEPEGELVSSTEFVEWLSRQG